VELLAKILLAFPEMAESVKKNSSWKQLKCIRKRRSPALGDCSHVEKWHCVLASASLRGLLILLNKLFVCETIRLNRFAFDLVAILEESQMGDISRPIYLNLWGR